MTELNFKGKEFVFNHHLSVPFRPLIVHPEKGIGEPSLDGNLIIHGDNLHALKALLPLYAGKIDCIFIDPPYNTGNEGWCYNDNVNAPMIKEWLDANPVGIEDGLRHDKWCAMMWPRLRLLFNLLSENGAMFVCIDDNELYHLRLILDEISGNPSNWIGTIVWKNATDNNPTRIAIEHEYIACFSKNKDLVDKVWKSVLSGVKKILIDIGNDFIKQYPENDERQKEYTKWFRENRSQLWPLDRYKYIDAEGIYTGSQSVHNPGREGYRYDVLHPKTGLPCKQPLLGYRFPEETMRNLLDRDKILFGDNHNKIVEIKVYAKDYLEKLPSVIELDGRTAAYELREIFPDRNKAFDNPKPTQIIDKILSFSTSNESVILDSFAGSGTTAHAVLNLNREDGGARRFILVECEDYADSLTRERVSRVIRGIAAARNDVLKQGLGGAFTYCTLGNPVDFDKLLTGDALPPYEGIGAALFHMATNRAFDPTTVREDDCYLGEADGQHVWLIYRPDLEWLKSADAALTLTRAREFAETAPDERHLVFAPARYVSQKILSEQNIPVEFVPLPFALYRVDRS
ncbi:MAG: site-specific DNA-methyltransferase [Rhodospirillales bacterium]|nr:site-specific DNA-methyltransferase [Rhodospirillales bacterium]